jgi:hypothetical protein
MLMITMRALINVTALDIIIIMAIITVHVHPIIRMIRTAGIHQNMNTINIIMIPTIISKEVTRLTDMSIMEIGIILIIVVMTTVIRPVEVDLTTQIMVVMEAFTNIIN